MQSGPGRPSLHSKFQTRQGGLQSKICLERKTAWKEFFFQERKREEDSHAGLLCRSGSPANRASELASVEMTAGSGVQGVENTQKLPLMRL